MKKAGLFVWLFLIAALSVLGACGKMSSPTPYEGSGYPHSYPRQ